MCKPVVCLLRLTGTGWKKAHEDNKDHKGPFFCPIHWSKCFIRNSTSTPKETTNRPGPMQPMQHKKIDEFWPFIFFKCFLLIKLSKTQTQSVSSTQIQNKVSYSWITYSIFKITKQTLERRNAFRTITWRNWWMRREAAKFKRFRHTFFGWTRLAYPQSRY